MTKTLYLSEGTITVTAKGYWFTSGGDKAPFGYYPHLKKKEGDQVYPVYPDTQVHGDLKMAARWLARLGAADPALIANVFGHAGQAASSRLKLTDLELTKEAKIPWEKKRFDVKTRCRINEDTRTNEAGMLADMEWAWLNDLTLECRIFLGYFYDKNELEAAQELIQQAVALLSGFGASRSRGYGRGTITINFETFKTVSADPMPPGNSQDDVGLYFLTPCTPFRSKPLNPGATQLIASQKSIAPAQIKGWFVRTYQALFDEWPSPEQMARLQISAARPCLKENGAVVPAVPSPCTTLEMDDKRIEDRYGKQDKTKNGAEDKETFTHTKAKPLKDNMFLTCEMEPRLVRLETETRLRNATVKEDRLTNASPEFGDETFATLKEGGLFAQELIQPGRPFCATVKITPANGDDFAARAGFILKNVMPDINGTFFTGELKNGAGSGLAKSKGDPPWLVCEPVVLEPKFLGNKGNQIKMAVSRTYNTMQQRPRRNRIVVAPGSLIQEEVTGKTLSWPHLGKEIQKAQTKVGPPKKGKTKQDENAAVLSKEIVAAIKGLSRSQAGNLRELRLVKPAIAKKRIEDILEKYEDWKKEEIDKHLIPKIVLDDLLTLLAADNKPEYPKFHAKIQALCEAFAEKEWEKTKTGTAEKLKKEWNQKFGKPKTASGKKEATS